MSKIYLLIAIFYCFSCNNRTNNWINQEEGTGLLNIWKYETTKVFLDKTQYCYDNRKISFTDLDGILFAFVQIPDYDLKELFKLSMKHKWDKMYLIYHEFEGSKYDIVATILLYSNNKYFGYSMDYQKRKIYNTNIIQGFEIWNIKPSQEYLDNNFFVLTEYNHAFKIVSNKIFIGTEIRHELFQLYKVPGL